MRPRATSRRPAATISLALMGLLLVLSGCASEDTRQQEFEALIEAKNWEEIRARVQLLRQEGASGRWIDLAEGLALLHQNADKAAEPLFASAVAADSSLAPRIAAQLGALAEADFAQGWEERGRRRYAEAIRLQPGFDPGEHLGTVADYFFRFEKDYARAFPLYRRLYRERPEPASRHMEWVYRYGHCLETLGFEENAMAVYDEFVETWPEDRSIMRYVQWRRMNVMLEQAERLRTQAQPAQALELLERCIDIGWHVDQQQRARYLAGQIEEDRDQLHAARDWYEQVVDTGGRASSQLVEQARARLDALGALGVH